MDDPFENLYFKEVMELLYKQLATLEKRECDVLCRHFMFGETYSDIGKTLPNFSYAGKGVITKGLSVGRVRMIAEKALRKMRHPSRAIGLSGAIYLLRETE